MTNFRITVRGTDIELRGYVSGSANVQLVANTMDGLGVVIASPMPFDVEPISEPTPTMEASLTHLDALAMESPDLVTFVKSVAQLHFMQAMVIRGERDQREQVERELARYRDAEPGR